MKVNHPRAKTVGMRFKLTKCFFCQLEVNLLGMTVGQGTVKADPGKLQALTAWPRPSRREDVERFLCTMGFIRQHLTPKFSEIAQPLRETLSVLHEKRRAGGPPT